MIDPAIQAYLEEPIGSRELQKSGVRLDKNPVAIEAARRASKIWLPEGKRSANTREARAARQAMLEKQIDIEDAIEAAGGARGSIAAA